MFGHEGMTARRGQLRGGDQVACEVGARSGLFVARQKVRQLVSDGLEVVGATQQFLQHPRRRGHREGRCFFPPRVAAPE